MAKESVEKRYEKHGRIKPCVLTRDDILAMIIVVMLAISGGTVLPFMR